MNKTPIEQATALQIAEEDYCMDGSEDIEDFKNLIELHYNYSAVPRINILRVSDGIAVRYAGMDSYEAVREFFKDAYRQGMDAEHFYTAEQAAASMVILLSGERAFGHEPDEMTDDTEVEPDGSDETLLEAVGWFLRWLDATERCRGCVPSSEHFKDRLTPFWCRNTGDKLDTWRDAIRRLLDDPLWSGYRALAGYAEASWSRDV